MDAKSIMNDLFFKSTKEVILQQTNVNVLDTDTDEKIKKHFLKEKIYNFFEGERRIDYGFLMLESKINDDKMYVVLSEIFDKNGEEKYKQLSIVYHFSELKQKIDFHFNIHNAEDCNPEDFEKQLKQYIETHKLNRSKNCIREICLAVGMLMLNINMNTNMNITKLIFEE